MQAEERYGAGGFQCASCMLFAFTTSAEYSRADVGNGQYKPYPQAQGALIPGQAPPPNYGATQ